MKNTQLLNSFISAPSFSTVISSFYSLAHELAKKQFLIEERRNTVAAVSDRFAGDAVSDSKLKDSVRDSLRKFRDDLLISGIANSNERAKILSRTYSIWFYNESAQERYVAEGIEEKEWLCAVDDMLCEICASMNGKVVGVRDMYAEKGGRIEYSEITEGANKVNPKIYVSPCDIEHPPLHPNCRCCISPVVEF